MKLRKRKLVIKRKISQQYIIVRAIEKESFAAFLNGFKNGRVDQLNKLKDEK